MKLVLSVLVLSALVTLTSQAETPEQLPVAAALVDGENSDLGEMKICLVRTLIPGIVLSNTAARNPIDILLLLGEHPWHVGIVREESKTGFFGWVRHLGGKLEIIQTELKYHTSYFRLDQDNNILRCDPD